MTVWDKQRLDRFEQRVLGRIFGPRRDGERLGYLRSIEEVLATYAGVPLYVYVLTPRLLWAGHVTRMGGNRLTHAILDFGTEGNPPSKYLDYGEVAENASLVGSENWLEDAQDRRG